MTELLPKETTEPTKMILLILKMIIREMIEDQLQETEDVLVLETEDLDLVVVEEDLTLAKEGEAEVGIVEAGVVIEGAGAEIEDVTEVVREEKERWNEREENGNGDVVMNEKERTEDEEKGKENVRGRKKWQESCGRRNVKLREREGMMKKRGV